jgi:2-polyprenyl-3-methyl-5-hydroxy-6-metoxy-1,4-benzoquinol methylase
VKTSQHYAGPPGEQYAAQKQSDPLNPGYAIDFAYFRPYLKRTDIVLDFGCGNGGILRLIAQVVQQAEGLEVNPASAAMARVQQLTVFSSFDALVREPRYDIIVSNHVLEHVCDVCSTLERLRAHLKPGGRLVMKLPIDDARTKYQRGWSRNDSDHHLQTWTPRLFANVLFESGFEVNECRVVTSAWHPRLFPLMKIGLGRFAFWMFALIKRRRQLFAVATNPFS